MLELNEMEARGGAKGEKGHTPANISLILTEFDSVFNMPPGLPPIRNREHTIVLKEGSNLVGVRPYRYPQFQKDETEKLIKEMLMAGIIKPSTSPFSSVFYLLKRKMGRGGFVWTTGH